MNSNVNVKEANGPLFALQHSMIIKIFCYLSILSIILFLPESLWGKIWQKFMRVIDYIKEMKEKNPLNQEAVSGQRLLVFFPTLEARMSMGQKTIESDLPKYKFYTTLITDLLETHQKRGISLKNILPELRLNLIKDLQFESKISRGVMGGNLQFFAIMFTTWMFIFLSSKLAELPLNLFMLFIIALFQLAGIVVFNAALKKIKFLTFKKFNQAIERLYLFHCLSEVGLSITHTLTESQVLKGDLMTQKVFSPCASRLTTLVNRWTQNGISPKAETHEIIKEVWHLKEVTFERFLKHLDLLKFIILAFFFLPAYFLYLYSIFQFFMEQ